MYEQWKRFWETAANWELWPFWMRYVFISPVWLWYCLRSGSFWFFSASNPTLTFGGFEGEGKEEMYALLPPQSYPKTLFIKPGQPFGAVERAVADAGFTYPFCAKPDVGMKGLLFRKLDAAAHLQRYHQYVPVYYMVQELIDDPLEVSVFYYRHPAQQKGVITGFIQKDLMQVTGDGRKTLLQLMEAHPKAKHRLPEMEAKHGAMLHQVLPAGQTFPLVHAANLSRGAQFQNLGHLIDADLHARFDALSHTAQFYYGRYDIKCRSVADLKAGRHFSVLEFNGAGAEPNHVFNAGYSLFGAQRVFLQHWKILYTISKYNHRAGYRYWPFLKGWRFLRHAKKHLRLLEKQDHALGG